MATLTNPQKKALLKKLQAISPVWASSLAAHNPPKDISPVAADAKERIAERGIVGEAWDNDYDYVRMEKGKHCSDCVWFSAALIPLTYSHTYTSDIKIEGNELVWYFLEQFIAHWEKEHDINRTCYQEKVK